MTTVPHPGPHHGQFLNLVEEVDVRDRNHRLLDVLKQKEQQVISKIIGWMIP